MRATPPDAGAPVPTPAARAVFTQAAERQKAGDSAGAMKLYAQAIELFPAFSDAYNNLGVLLRAADKLPAAAACIKRALLYSPNNGSLYSNLGNVLWQQLRFEESHQAYRRAVELDPDRPETMHNLGLLLHSMGQHAAAIECFDRAVRRAPDNPEMQWDRALSRLASGDLARGFVEYEARWRLKQSPMRQLPMPLWQGQDLTTRSLFVHCEQGLGDTLQFCRYLSIVAGRCQRLVFECQPELERLMAGFPGVAQLTTTGSPPPAADFHVPLMSLARLLGTTLETVPAPGPYLHAIAGPAPAVVRPAGTRLAVGIVWAGRPSHNNDRNRSTTLERFLALADLPGVALYSLQKGLRAADIDALGVTALIQDLGSRVNNFADTAAVLQQLDLVVSVDTGVVHLAGAMGKPVFTLLPYTPDWRWLAGRDDSPWYPSMRLFRQTAPRDWDGVFVRLRQAVAALLAPR
jgi:Tfp pilus assembly protein PilF